VIDPIYEDGSGVRAFRCSPVAEDLGEVGDVVRNEDALVLGCQLEDVLVVESFVLPLPIERSDVVTLLGERPSEGARRRVGSVRMLAARLEEGSLPRRANPSPFLDDDARRDLDERTRSRLVRPSRSAYQG